MHKIVCMKSLIVAILALCLLTAGIATAAVSFKASVDKVETPYEGKVNLDLEVTVSDQQIETKPLPPPEMVGFRIGGSVSSVTQEGGNTVRHYQYELIPAQSGPVKIPAFALEYSDSTSVDTLYSQPIVVTVAQPLPKEEESKPWWIYVITAIVLVVGVWWWIRRERVAEEEKTEPEWQAEYRKQLEEATELAERQKYREFFDKGSKLLVSLLEKLFDTPLKGKTVDNLSEWVAQQELTDEQKGAIGGFLKESESVKFTTGEVDRQTAENKLAELKRIVEQLLA